MLVGHADERRGCHHVWVERDSGISTPTYYQPRQAGIPGQPLSPSTWGWDERSPSPTPTPFVRRVRSKEKKKLCCGRGKRSPGCRTRRLAKATRNEEIRRASGELEPGAGIAIGPAPGAEKWKRSMSLTGVGAGIVADVPPPGAPGWSPTFPSPPYRGIVMVPPLGTGNNMPGDGLLMSDWFKGTAPSACALRSLSLLM
ncbi:hypothetical protein LZ30DRAFT_705067 [Colletotrichum cereale]|nr:hypothetical protein LZ30DRAFT_705067 [Colletotrichum cereale]